MTRKCSLTIPKRTTWLVGTVSSARGKLRLSKQDSTHLFWQSLHQGIEADLVNECLGESSGKDILP
jgi:hypothetical protein